jgi:general nucleoside transport system permease protein
VTLFGAISLSPFDAGWLAAALVLTTPVLLTAIGELISERAGVLNVGLEGMMVAGAFVAYLVTYKLHSLALGVILGMCGGIAFAVVMALLAVEARADQVVAGVGINLMAIGLTSYLFQEIFEGETQVVVDRVGNVPIPLLSDIPEVGNALFDHDPFVYLAFLLVPASWFLLYRTRWGLAIRASGEVPAAADTAGISVRKVRWGAILAAGALAGLGGAHLTVVSVGIFADDIPAGRGYLALIAVIFGRWRPVGVLAACLLLGGADALRIRLTLLDSVPRVFWVVLALTAIIFLVRLIALQRGRADRGSTTFVVAVALLGLVFAVATPHIDLPAQFWRTLPYMIGLLALGAAVTRARMPSRLAYPYQRGEG